MVGAFFSYGFGSARTYANNVEQRETKMKFSDIKFNQTKIPKGIQALFNFGDKFEFNFLFLTKSGYDLQAKISFSTPINNWLHTIS